MIGSRTDVFGQTMHDVPIPGDFDGNGVTDIAVFRPSTSQWFVTLRNAAGTMIGSRTFAYGLIDLLDIPVLGDFDGNGVTDVAVFRPATAQWLITLGDRSGNVIGRRTFAYGGTS